MMALVESLGTEEISRWAGSCDRAFAIPIEADNIIGAGFDGALANIVTVCCNMPAAVVHGPSSLGGLDMCPLYEEQGASKIQHFLKHWRSQSEVSNLLRIMMSWTQKYSGVGSPILQYPNRVLPHLARLPFIASMREFLSKINGRLVLDENFAVPLQREYDEHLMDIVIESRLLTPKEIVLFNYCQHFLEVYTISDISEANV
jgi:hypothetical protein